MKSLTWVPLILLLIVAGCAGHGGAPGVRAAGSAGPSIYVINHGKHGGLAVGRADIPSTLLPEKEDFPGADYLELGWGDWDYYQADDPGVWLALKAALWPTASVLNVIGVQGSLRSRFAGYEVIRLQPSGRAFLKLLSYVDRSFDRKGARKAAPVGPKRHGQDLFYPAHGSFHLFNTCNAWVARALEAAGYSMGIFPPVTADQLMAKVHPYAVRPPESGTAGADRGCTDCRRSAGTESVSPVSTSSITPAARSNPEETGPARCGTIAPP